MKQAFLVAGLAWGDEGKGATVDFLTRHYNADLNVRYNGGSQASHNVVTPDGRHHPFSQFGSGSFHPGVKTHLSRFCLVNPINMQREADALIAHGVTDIWDRTSVDPRALIVTPFHREINRVAQHPGTSCGQGIGVCRGFHLAHGDKALFAGDLVNEDTTREKLRYIQDHLCKRFPMFIDKTTPLLLDHANPDPTAIDTIWSWYRDWPLQHFRTSEQALTDADTVIFEGAQGVLLDETHGEAGFNTWTDTTFNNADKLLDEVDHGFKSANYTRIGVVRTYHTRHGRGQFPTEDPNQRFAEPHNDNDGFQGAFRQGPFDPRLHQKALEICGGIHTLAINHMDVTRAPIPIEVPRVIEGHGPTYLDREIRR